jgi:hypothetical protein
VVLPPYLVSNKIGKSCMSVVQQTAPKGLIGDHVEGGRSRTSPSKASPVSSPECGMPPRCRMQYRIHRVKWPIRGRAADVKAINPRQIFEKNGTLPGAVVDSAAPSRESLLRFD